MSILHIFCIPLKSSLVYSKSNISNSARGKDPDYKPGAVVSATIEVMILLLFI